jgi:hypothetical protein
MVRSSSGGSGKGRLVVEAILAREGRGLDRIRSGAREGGEGAVCGRNLGGVE